MKPKLLVIASYSRSLILFRKDLMKEFVQKGWEVLAMAPEWEESVIADLNREGIRFQAIPLERTGINIIQDIGLLLYLYREIKRYSPTCILPYTIKPVIYGSLAARFFPATSVYPMITGLGNMETDSPTWKHRIRKRILLTLYRIALKKITGILFQNQDDRNFFEEHSLIPESIKRIVVPGSGINLKSFQQQPPLKEPVVFLFIARLLKAKGVSYFIDAARRIKESRSDVQFHLIGQADSSNPDSLEEEVLAKAVASKTVVYHGFQEDVRPFLKNASVFVLPSYYREGVPRTILEAMAIGRAVITTDHVGCRETVIPGNNGFLVKPKDVDSLVKAMTGFTDHPQQIIEMGNNSRKRAEEVYDVDKVNKLILNFMEVD